MSGVDFDRYNMLCDLAKKKAKVWALTKVCLDSEKLKAGEAFISTIGVFASKNDADRASEWLEKKTSESKYIYLVNLSEIKEWKGD